MVRALRSYDHLVCFGSAVGPALPDDLSRRLSTSELECFRNFSHNIGDYIAAVGVTPSTDTCPLPTTTTTVAAATTTTTLTHARTHMHAAIAQ